MSLLGTFILSLLRTPAVEPHQPATWRDLHQLYYARVTTPSSYSKEKNSEHTSLEPELANAGGEAKFAHRCNGEDRSRSDRLTRCQVGHESARRTSNVFPPVRVRVTAETCTALA